MRRSGPDHPAWKEDAYRSTCFRYHGKKCIVCGEDKIVAVHHYDHNRANNRPENLIPLCPNHHTYLHSRYGEEVRDRVEEYREEFLQMRAGLLTDDDYDMFEE